MRRLDIARVATSTPMGAEAYQAQIIGAARPALARTSTDAWRVDELVFRSLRSRLEGNRRLPLGRVAVAPAGVRRTLGRALFRGDVVTHRMSLELPPGAIDVVTLHDTVAWEFSDESAPVPAAAAELRRAAAVICVSEFSAGRAVELLGIDPPHVIHNGVDAHYFDAVPLDSSTLAGLGMTSPYVLHAGGAAVRKNLAALAEAWPLVHRERPDLTLALVGPPHPRRTELFEGMPGVRLLGRVDGALMPGLVAGAATVVVPSLYEGFGLPALEGMAAGAPVVAANTSSLPEVVGETGILTEPTGVALAAGMLDATSGDPSIAATVTAARTRARAFTWERSADAHAQVWASVS
ncbi:glycosyltransferase family 1 protein [Microbacterium istanbulense]|uniref:Glycosyltransferase family 1 protein n=1 Tax=Microbacterium istanbulense TaxID=3122049 RepID=A0ABU8LHA6_9MICO